MTPTQRANAIVGEVWAGRSDYAGLYSAHVDSEARALRYEAALRDIASASTCAGSRSMARTALALATAGNEGGSSV